MIRAFWTIGLLVLSFGFFYSTRSFIRLAARYIFDGADSRVPYLITLFTFNLVLYLEIYYFLFTGYISSVMIFQVHIYTFMWASYLFRSRLSGYVTMTLNKNLKNTVYIIFTILFWVVLLLMFINFNPELMSNSVKVEFLSQLHFSKFVDMFRFNFFGSFSFPFYLISNFLAPALLFWFDILERRWKHIKLNCLFLIPIVLTTLMLFNFSVDCVIVTIGILYLFFPVALLAKETRSVIRHSNRIDTRVNQINKIIKSIVKICPQCPGHCIIRNENCKMNLAQRFQIKLIAKMIIDDPGLEDIIMRRHFFNHKKYVNVYEKINQAIVMERERQKELESTIPTNVQLQL